MIHCFDIDIAEEYGLHSAIIFQNIAHWVAHNEANGTNFYEDAYWTYNSVRAFSELFPYLTEKQIRSALDKLLQSGLIRTGNFNEKTYDRTLWYTLTEKGKSILHTGQMDLPHKANGFAIEGKPIPDINTYNKPDINSDNIFVDKSKKCGSSSEIQSIFDMYHEICVSLPKVKIITEGRKTAVKTKLKKYSIEQIREVFTKAEASDFLTGRVKEFKANFDWIIKESNFAKIIEGNYDNRNNQQSESDNDDDMFMSLSIN